MKEKTEDREALHRCLDAIPEHVWDAATEMDDVTGIIDAILAVGFSRAAVPDAATERIAALEEALTEECRQLARATVHTAAAMGSMRLAMGEEMVKLGYEGLREKLALVKAERDAALAALERVRAIHRETGAGGECVVCKGWGWPCPTVVALDGAPEPEVEP